MDAVKPMPAPSRLRRLVDRFADVAEALAAQPIDSLDRRLADIERRVARIETRLSAVAPINVKEI